VQSLCRNLRRKVRKTFSILSKNLRLRTPAPGGCSYGKRHHAACAFHIRSRQYYWRPFPEPLGVRILYAVSPPAKDTNALRVSLFYPQIRKPFGPLACCPSWTAARRSSPLTRALPSDRSGNTFRLSTQAFRSRLLRIMRRICRKPPSIANGPRLPCRAGLWCTCTVLFEASPKAPLPAGCPARVLISPHSRAPTKRSSEKTVT